MKVVDCFLDGYRSYISNLVIPETEYLLAYHFFDLTNGDLKT